MLLVYNSLLLCFSSLLLVCIGADNLPTCQPVRYYSLSICCCSISSIGNLYISSVVVVLVIFHVCIRCDNNSGISITSWLNAIRRVADGESRTLYTFRLYNWFFFCAGIFILFAFYILVFLRLESVLVEHQMLPFAFKIAVNKSYFYFYF